MQAKVKSKSLKFNSLIVNSNYFHIDASTFILSGYETQRENH